MLGSVLWTTSLSLHIHLRRQIIVTPSKSLCHVLLGSNELTGMNEFLAEVTGDGKTSKTASYHLDVVDEVFLMPFTTPQSYDGLKRRIENVSHGGLGE